MKTNRIERKGGRNALVIAAVIAVCAVIAGIIVGYDQLHAIWIEQCEITDMSSQVKISSGKMVKSEVIAEFFGLRNGANLALIDFNEKRTEILKKIPNLKSISISRQLPDKVTISADERMPIARLELRGRASSTGKVVDSEGMVFLCRRGTGMLPVIREVTPPGTAPGQLLKGRRSAALQFVEMCRNPEFIEFSLLEIDLSHPDFLLATLGRDYSTVKLAWDGMNDPATPESTAGLRRQLKHLRDSMQSKIGEGAVEWNATDTSSPGRIYANVKGNLK